MSDSFFQKIAIRNYGCIQDLTLEPSPLHALIGPNDSGKSTILRAIRTVCEQANGYYKASLDDPMLERVKQPVFELNFTNGSYGTRLAEERDTYHETLCYLNDKIADDRRVTLSNVGIIPRTEQDSRLSSKFETIRSRLTPTILLRLDPDALRSAASLLPETEGIRFQDERGTGLPATLDAIMNRDINQFIAIQDEIIKHFVNVRNIGLLNVGSKKELAVTLKDGTRLPAKALSEGLLYFLAFTVLRHITTSRIFLIEEPENGLHPARISEVMKILREISKTNQVFIATHSPLVVNELEANEISLITRDVNSGSTATRLDKTTNYANRSKVYLNGELWIAYGDAISETKLTDPLATESTKE